MKQTSKDRPRKYRENQNSERMDKVKEKKKLQNKAYKEKLEKRRQSNEELDKVCNFRKKKLWEQKSRKRERAITTNSTTPVTKKSRQKTRRTECRGRRLIGSYIRSWERPGALPRVIEILCLFASGAQRNERKDTTISITSGRSPGLSQQRM